jgi:hypothetical protein
VFKFAPQKKKQKFNRARSANTKIFDNIYFLDILEMAEFAEESLEKLLPAFEAIKASELFSQDRFNAFVQQCSRFEYRLQKRVSF